VAVATPDDVAVAIGRPISDAAERSQVDYWLNAAELQIKTRLGDVTLLDQEALKYVETEAVVAKMNNPSGAQSETIDDYTYRYGSETRRVTILSEWWELLSPTGASAAFSVRPSFTPDTDPNVQTWA
jgi:hypothetical protein